MNYEQAIKPTAFMKQDALETLYPQDCFQSILQNQPNMLLFRCSLLIR